MEELFYLSIDDHCYIFFQHEGHNIFSKFSSSEYKSILGHIKYCILATDLAVFFGNKGKLKKLLDNKQFSWKEFEHT
jgi:cAMP and cAMP-inhibited cGMP 3',5'-cyclic phosphodiesterase 10